MRPLSQGRRTGVIFTRTVAESVMLARVLHYLREQSWGIDSTSSKMWAEQKPGVAVPSKTEAASEFMDPLAVRKLPDTRQRV